MTFVFLDDDGCTVQTTAKTVLSAKRKINKIRRLFGHPTPALKFIRRKN
jgi:hypothetical protein